MAKPKDTAFLELHGPSWRVRVKVPERLRPLLGVSKLVAPLHTDSLAIANRDKHKHIHALKQRIVEAETELRRRNKKPADPLVEEALDWRAALKGDAAYGGDPDDPTPAADALSARLDELEAREGKARAGVLASIAFGRATPLCPLADEWLEVKPISFGRSRLQTCGGEAGGVAARQVAAPYCRDHHPSCRLGLP